MEWSSELKELRVELDSLRKERERRAGEEEAERQQRLAQVNGLLQSLRIEAALEEMNRLLLDGQGEVDIFVPGEWEEVTEDEEEGATDGEDTEDEEVEEDDDTVSAILTWQEDGTREIAVDIGMIKTGLYLRVNGDDIRLEQDAVRQALLRAFREEVGI